MPTRYFINADGSMTAIEITQRFRLKGKGFRLPYSRRQKHTPQQLLELIMSQPQRERRTKAKPKPEIGFAHEKLSLNSMFRMFKTSISSLTWVETLIFFFITIALGELSSGNVRIFAVMLLYENAIIILIKKHDQFIEIAYPASVLTLGLVFCLTEYFYKPDLFSPTLALIAGLLVGFLFLFPVSLIMWIRARVIRSR